MQNFIFGYEKQRGCTTFCAGDTADCKGRGSGPRQSSKTTCANASLRE
jgi:hypothetical protein